MSVGIRELKDHLSQHLGQVKEGNTVTVTEHGKPIARIVPLDSTTPFERLMAEGRITPAARAKQPAPDPMPADGSVSDLVAEQRR